MAIDILNELLERQAVLEKSFEKLSEKLDQNIKKTPAIQVDHQAISEKVILEMKRNLPTTETFREANEELKRTVSYIPKEIRVKDQGQIIGFSNWKSMLLHYGIFFLVSAAVCAKIIYDKNQQIATLTEYNRDASDFVRWIREGYPKVWEKWEKQ